MDFYTSIEVSKEDYIEQCRIYEVIAGSTARGLHVTQADVDAGKAEKISDVDIQGIFLPKIGHYFGFNRVPNSISFGSDIVWRDLQTFMFYLVGKHTGEPIPEFVEMMFAEEEHIRYCSTFFKDAIKEHRDKLLCLPFARKLAISGKAIHNGAIDLFFRSQKYVGDHVKDEKNAYKNIMDALRRTLQARYLLEKGTYLPKLPKTDIVRLKQVRFKELPFQETSNWCTLEHMKVADLLEKNPHNLPLEVPVADFAGWLKSTYKWRSWE